MGLYISREIFFSAGVAGAFPRDSFGNIVVAEGAGSSDFKSSSLSGGSRLSSGSGSMRRSEGLLGFFGIDRRASTREVADTLAAAGRLEQRRSYLEPAIAHYEMMQGWLTKVRNARVSFRQNPKQWFILQGTQLTYHQANKLYATENPATVRESAKGVIDLASCEAVTPRGERDLIIQVNRVKSYHLVAADRDERDRWVDTMLKVHSKNITRQPSTRRNSPLASFSEPKSRTSSTGNKPPTFSGEILAAIPSNEAIDLPPPSSIPAINITPSPPAESIGQHASPPADNTRVAPYSPVDSTNAIDPKKVARSASRIALRDSIKRYTSSFRSSSKKKASPAADIKSEAAPADVPPVQTVEIPALVVKTEVKSPLPASLGQSLLPASTLLRKQKSNGSARGFDLSKLASSLSDDLGLISGSQTRTKTQETNIESHESIDHVSQASMHRGSNPPYTPITLKSDSTIRRSSILDTDALVNLRVKKTPETGEFTHDPKLSALLKMKKRKSAGSGRSFDLSSVRSSFSDDIDRVISLDSSPKGSRAFFKPGTDMTDTSAADAHGLPPFYQPTSPLGRVPSNATTPLKHTSSNEKVLVNIEISSGGNVSRNASTKSGNISRVSSKNTPPMRRYLGSPVHHVPVHLPTKPSADSGMIASVATPTTQHKAHGSPTLRLKTATSRESPKFHETVI